jgi:hypothetical protein
MAGHAKVSKATRTNASKATRTNASKAESQQDDKPLKVTLHIAPKLAKQFATHAVQTGQSKSALFAEMVQAHCRRFIVHDHAKEEGRGRATGETGAGPTGEDVPRDGGSDRAGGRPMREDSTD